MYFYEHYHYGNESSYSAFELVNPTYPANFHRCFEAISLQSGHLHVRIGAGEYDLSAGDLCMVFPYQVHCYETVEESVVEFLIFSPEMIRQFSEDFHDCLPESAVIHGYSFTKEQAARTNVYAQKALLYELCAAFSAQAKIVRANPLRDKMSLLHRILTYMEENYGESCSLHDLAQATGYDYAYLSRYFKAEMGVTYSQFLNQIRIRNACKLLRETNVPISEIAFRCGYDSIRTFNRNFIAVAGTTPRYYR